MTIRMNAVSPTAPLLIQGVHCEGEVAEVSGQWWVQLGRHPNSEVASQYPFLPFPPTHQPAKPHRLTGSNKARQSLGSPAEDGCWIYCMHMITYSSRPQGDQMGETQICPKAETRSELSRTSPACEITLCFRRRNEMPSRWANAKSLQGRKSG